MAVDQFIIPGESGNAANLRATYSNAAGQVGNSVTGLFEAYTLANYSQYQVSGFAEGEPEHFTLTQPAWASAATLIVVRRADTGTAGGDPIVWQGPPSSLTASAATVTVQSGSPLPPTRDLPFYFYIENTLTDTTTAPTVTVTRIDTGATVYAAGTAMTHAATGVYRLTVPETGLGYQYVVAFTYPAGVPHTRTYTSYAAGLHYSSTQGVYDELGQDNALIWGNLSSSGTNEDSPASIESALTQADVRVNLKLGAYSPPPATFPVTSTAAWVNDVIATAAAKYAAGYLLNKRDRQSRSGSSANDASPGDRLIADGDALLADLIAGGLVGVTLATTDVDAELNTLSPVAVAATKDACGCPVPAVTCCDYGYRSRLYVYP